MSVVDASVWVSLLVASDVHHHASRQWLEEHVTQGGQLVAPILALAEVAGAISRRTGAVQLGTQALDTLQRLPALRLVALDRRLGEAAGRAAAELGLRGADAVYVALAQQLRLPLITWDNEQIGKAAGHTVVLSPTR